ncbi:MAG: hypothetical protein JOZ10_04225 [Acidobacteria bacterium]|nr:hypothetical protein [Acidobacteriota bacterium]MBV9146953.1 hypothetical protein [Acidobacteriota bacterium]MBV9436742.1 hypothetical protein [Acidobacteriota bacterium]
MKIRICFLVMMLAPLVYYGAIQMAPAGRAATVSSGFHQLGKLALQKIEAAQDALGDSEEAFNARLAEADRAMAVASGAAHSAADQRDYTRLVGYLQTVKQQRILAQAAADPSQPPDHDQIDAARQGAETAFQ